MVTHAEIAHIIPLCRGGTDEIENLMLACHECNHLEGLSYNDKPKEVK